MGMTAADGTMASMAEVGDRLGLGQGLAHGPVSLPVLPSSRAGPRRHYKKDTRFLLDLYHLTYDDHESLDTLDDLSTVG